MSKELTEKYYTGTLPSGHYYFSNGNSVYPIEYRQVEPFLCANGITVLCEVPSYEEYKDFEQDKKQLSRISEQLKEANEILKGLYNDNPCRFDHNGYCQEHNSTDGNYICVQGELKEYLTKYGL